MKISNEYLEEINPKGYITGETLEKLDIFLCNVDLTSNQKKELISIINFIIMDTLLH
jgi:hypothetical protein